VFRSDGTLTVELTGRCVYDCPWCTSRALTSAACTCGRWDDGEPLLPIERLIEAMEDLSLVGVNRLVVRGGEPLLEPDRLWALIRAALGRGLRCEIHSTGLPLDERAFGEVAGRPVSFVLMIPTHLEAAFDRAAGAAGSWTRLRSHLAALRTAGVSFRAIVPAAIDAPEAAERTAAWARAEGARDVEYLVYVPAGASGLPELRQALAPRTPTDMGSMRRASS
jgi:pyruvate-formate lyase-activating enzyme